MKRKGKGKPKVFVPKKPLNADFLFYKVGRLEFEKKKERRQR